MKVSQLARRVGIAPSAIRFYESQGVLPSPARGTNGYRDYSEIDLVRLTMFRTLRSLGIEPGESARLASMCAAGECDEMDDQLLPQLAQRRAEIAAARADLDRLDAQLAGLQESIQAGPLCEPGGGSGKGDAACDCSPC